ncbi:hypothetical protein RHSIM_Rhsim11G0048200 [Rhododendron simsii]|uniref:Uncharacterized protein n=1 Tax=Rhododendron simsii TaxID=118357 RepID=A0A834L891_RHOSS|nr:hypothetical protein RHSIM_Rhsim11G0048200 [Rhododendron simsii]
MPILICAYTCSSSSRSRRSVSWVTTHHAPPAHVREKHYVLSGPSVFYRGALHWLLEPSSVIAYNISAKTVSFSLVTVPGIRGWGWGWGVRLCQEDEECCVVFQWLLQLQMFRIIDCAGKLYLKRRILWFLQGMPDYAHLLILSDCPGGIPHLYILALFSFALTPGPFGTVPKFKERLERRAKHVRRSWNDDNLFHLYEQSCISQVAGRYFPPPTDLDATGPPMWSSYKFYAPFSIGGLRDTVYRVTIYCDTASSRWDRSAASARWWDRSAASARLDRCILGVRRC